MGISSSKCPPTVITRCAAPPYCIKMVGSRHVIIGGGGGASKTGVSNEIQTFLLTFGHIDTDCCPKTSMLPLQAVLTSVLKTGPHATMNMDVVSIGSPESGKYLLAAGHDEYCCFYFSDGFSISDLKKEVDVPTLNFKEIFKITSDEKRSGAYQKTVRFDRTIVGQPRFVITGGSEGKLRVWNIEGLLDEKIRSQLRFVIPAHEGVVDEVGIAPDGCTFLSLGTDAKVYFWDIASGKKLAELPALPEFNNEYRVRTIQFTNLGSLNIIFVAAYNQKKRTSKCKSYLSLWALNREKLTFRLILIRQACLELISTMAISECGNYTVIGTLSGSVGVYDTHEMKAVYFARETHSIFVTAVEFLPKDVADVSHTEEEDRRKVPLPGIGAAYKVAVLSVSADQTVQFHVVPYRSPPSFSLLIVFAILYSFWYFLREWNFRY